MVFVSFYRMVVLQVLNLGCSYSSWFLFLTCILPVCSVCHISLTLFFLYIYIYTHSYLPIKNKIKNAYGDIILYDYF